MCECPLTCAKDSHHHHRCRCHHNFPPIKVVFYPLERFCWSRTKHSCLVPPVHWDKGQCWLFAEIKSTIKAWPASHPIIDDQPIVFKFSMIKDEKILRFWAPRLTEITTRHAVICLSAVWCQGSSARRRRRRFKVRALWSVLLCLHPLALMPGELYVIWWSTGWGQRSSALLLLNGKRGVEHPFFAYLCPKKRDGFCKERLPSRDFYTRALWKPTYNGTVWLIGGNGLSKIPAG